MKKITLTASTGESYTGHLPESWDDVALNKYAALAAAPDWPARTRALAALCGLPTQPLHDDVSLCLPILRGAPWLLNGPLPGLTDHSPTAQDRRPPHSFRHLGVVYVPAPADVQKINAGQLEGVLSFLREAEGNPLAAAPHLLACLYKPEGTQALTAEVVANSAAALASLPMAIGYVLLLDFWQRSAPFALPIQRYLAIRPVVEQLLNALEVVSQNSASPGPCSNMLAWLIARWIRRVKRLLKMS